MMQITQITDFLWLFTHITIFRLRLQLKSIFEVKINIIISVFESFANWYTMFIALDINFTSSLACLLSTQ